MVIAGILTTLSASAVFILACIGQAMCWAAGAAGALGFWVIGQIADRDKGKAR
jgi:hypothetical protein